MLRRSTKTPTTVREQRRCLHGRPYSGNSTQHSDRKRDQMQLQAKSLFNKPQNATHTQMLLNTWFAIPACSPELLLFSCHSVPFHSYILSTRAENKRCKFLEANLNLTTLILTPVVELLSQSACLVNAVGRLLKRKSKLKTAEYSCGAKLEEVGEIITLSVATVN